MSSLKKHFTASTRKRYAKRAAKLLATAGIVYGANKYHTAVVDNVRNSYETKLAEQKEHHAKQRRFIPEKVTVNLFKFGN